MSDDEGTEPTAQGVRPDDEPAADESGSSSAATGSGDEPRTADDTRADGNRENPGNQPVADDRDEPVAADTGDPDTPGDQQGPQTAGELRTLIDRIADHDESLAEEVTNVVQTARDVNETVEHQKRELTDLHERNDEQAETIEDLHAELGERDDRIAELESELSAREERIDDLESELEEKRDRVEELEGALKRKQADFQNYKKRAKKRQEQLKARATEDLVGRLVGVRDNLKRALEEDSDDAGSLREGVDMTLREFDRVLEDENVEEIDPEPGSEVDPQRHEVMVQVDSDEPEGAIADVFTPGYEMGEKVIQTAQVTVSNGALVEDEPSDGAADGSDDSAARAAESNEDRDSGTDPDADEAAPDADSPTDASDAESTANAPSAGGTDDAESDDGSTSDSASDAWEFGGEVAAEDGSDPDVTEGDRPDTADATSGDGSDGEDDAIELGGEIAEDAPDPDGSESDDR